MSKDKWVRRFSVDETARHKNGFTIYKITSVLFPLESPEVMTVVSVWKRYSDVQRLHTCMRSLHAGLHLRGTFPVLPKFSYFKRFQQEVIEERAKVIKALLEFIAEHKLLFTSTDFVNFLQTGYAEPESSGSGVINAIRTSLHLPIEDTPPLEYQTSDDDSRSPQHTVQQQPLSVDEADYISLIRVHEWAEVERDPPRAPRAPSRAPSRAHSLASITSLESAGSDFYTDLEKVTVQKTKSMIKKNVLPDLINFDAPSTSRFEDYHTMKNEDTLSIASANQNSEYSASIASTNQRSEISTNQSQFSRSNSRVSCQSVLSLSNIECKTKTEDSYVFEAGYMLNLAARYETMEEYDRAFECYKAGIEKMLIGVQTDTDHQRRALIKQKTNKYLSHAESIYKTHLCDATHPWVEPRGEVEGGAGWGVGVGGGVQSPPAPPAPPPGMLSRSRSELAQYRVLHTLAPRVMLVLHARDQTCYAMKVIEKIPCNLTEFDEYFLQNTNETRQPILPTVIPYMVTLQAYIETNNLIFLILSYAPGEKLFDYIKNYAKSTPNTPAREVNLENVFTEPKIKTEDISQTEIKKLDPKDVSDIKIQKLDVKNENLNLNSIIDMESDNKENSEISIVDRIEMNVCNNNETENYQIDNLDTKELVKNSQNLLKNVDRVLSEVTCKIEDVKIEVKEETEEVEDKERNERVERRVETPMKNRCGFLPTALMPSGAVSAWGAQILLALESLHHCGVVCRDLNPSNILLGECGQVILTYFPCYRGLDMSLAAVRAHSYPDLYLAPELYSRLLDDGRDDPLEHVCDYWSYGAIMYELLCGVPLSYYHRSVFTSHTQLYVPESIPLDARSLLTQLLTFSPAERLGAGGAGEVKTHPYYRHVDWDRTLRAWTPPTCRPSPTHTPAPSLSVVALARL